MRVNFFPILSFVGNNDENGVQVAGIIKDDGLLFSKACFNNPNTRK